MLVLVGCPTDWGVLLTGETRYKSSFTHPNDNEGCMELCIKQRDQIVQRPDRDPNEDDPVVHYRLIVSADQLMKDADARDCLAEKEGVLCFEMEAAGLMDRFPCVVIRGICDYSDTHKTTSGKDMRQLQRQPMQKSCSG